LKGREENLGGKKVSRELAVPGEVEEHGDEHRSFEAGERLLA